MTKTESLKQDLHQALSKFKQALESPETEMNRDAAIQRFEFTFELSWKLMYSVLSDQNISTYGTRNVIREAARLNLIDNPEDWFGFLQARNLTVHTYKESIAKEVYQRISAFPPLVDQLLTKITP
jgi:nucleotidyltransferase substrate binding protein (TIGR01987 family)